MYKMFIADDERLVIKSLRASINWKEYGFELIGEAYDGSEAYELISELKPDIVFVDIRMPGMNGLELMKKINEQSTNTVFVVISGYAEFAYAQKAISYGALGFCLKPFEESELLSVLKKAASVIEERTANIETGFLALIEDNSPDGLKKKKEILKSLGFDWNDKKGIVVAVSTGEAKLELKSVIKHIAFSIGKARYAYLLNDDAADRITDLYNGGRLPDGITSIGISNAHNSPDLMEAAVGEACTAAEQCFMTGEKGIYRFSQTDKDELDDLFHQLEATVLKKDVQLVKKQLEQVGEYFSRGIYSVRHAFWVYNTIIYSFSKAKAERYDDFILNHEMLMRSFKNAHEMLAFLRNVVMEYSGINKDNVNAEQKNMTFKNVFNYINEHYLENICIRDISRKFNVNANYLSHLFKKEEGMAFTEYITDLRINYACTLLKTTRMPVAEVAEKTGFNDYYYFTRVFKKITGKTPTAFRSSNCEKQ